MKKHVLAVASEVVFRVLCKCFQLLLFMLLITTVLPNMKAFLFREKIGSHFGDFVVFLLLCFGGTIERFLIV